MDGCATVVIAIQTETSRPCILLTDGLEEMYKQTPHLCSTLEHVKYMFHTRHMNDKRQLSNNQPFYITTIPTPAPTLFSALFAATTIKRVRISFKEHVQKAYNHPAISYTSNQDIACDLYNKKRFTKPSKILAALSFDYVSR